MTWPCDHRQDCRYCIWPFYRHVQNFSEAFYSDKQGARGYMSSMSKPPQMRLEPDPRVLWLLVVTPSALGPDLDYRWAEYSLLCRMPLDTFDILDIFDILFYHLRNLCIDFITYRLWLAICSRFWWGGFFANFEMCIRCGKTVHVNWFTTPLLWTSYFNCPS